MSNIAFKDLTVLDFSRYLPGGYATQVLADMGANVIKVEDTGLGDFMRHDYPTKGQGISYYITALGRNKKSISLNLKNKRIVEIFLKLAAKADVIVESFRPGVTKKLGIDYETIKTLNPGIIYCSISGYGSKDPRSLKAQHDINMQAQTGYLELNGKVTSPLHYCDLSSGMISAQSILAALYSRQITGEGAYIDTSMFDCFVWWNSLLDSRWCFNGGECKKDDLEYPATAYNIYETKDHQFLAFGMVEAKFWDPFCEAVGYPELKPARLKRRWEVSWAFELMENIVKSKTCEEWLGFADKHDFCIAKVNNKAEAIDMITSSDSNMLAWVDFPRVGKVLQTNLPHHISNIPVNISDFTPAPLLGENTQEYLARLGISNEEIAALHESGDIKFGSDTEPIKDEVPLKPEYRPF